MTTIEGYEVKETLHDSANSLVIRAVRSADGLPVVLKILKNDYPSPIELTRYRKEYEIVRSLAADGIVKAIDQRRYENTLMIVLQDFGGDSLARLMSRQRFPTEEALDIAVSLARALGAVHAGHVIHKDLNPSNVVYDPDTGRLEIIDFGIATRLSRESQPLTSPDVLEGTLAYMSPEQTGRMNRPVDHRADFYALGATLHQLFTGRVPFEAADAMELVHAHIAKEPPAAHRVDAACPRAVSRIIGKLLAKAAEDRYQGARGIVHDLELCRAAAREGREIEDLEPGREDRSERLRIPQKLYGRDAEIAAVLAAFARVSAGPSEMLLVSGYSGVGKSALIQEVYRPLTRQRGYFVAGKFDQLQRGVPFSAVVAALSDLVRQLLTEGEESLARHRQRLLDALGPNGQVIVDLIPDVELVVGPQPPVPELGFAEAMNRFNLVFLSFIRVFAGAGHPLVVFLDDLQWADSATLKLLDRLVTDDETPGLFLIGAYRDHEVGPVHPLKGTIAAIRGGGGRISEITLSPLGLRDTTELIADALRRSAEDVEPLARLVAQKTQGNPFFVGQFLETLHHDGLLEFGAPPGGGEPRWRWDVERIEAVGITENVVDLLVAKLRRLPGPTQDALRMAACIGNRFDLGTLSLIHDKGPAETYADLLPAIHEGHLLPTSEPGVLDPHEILSPLLVQHLRFQHDRVQQSAYALFDAGEARAVHLKIGRRFLATMSPERVHERIFEVVDNLNLGHALITDPAERLRLSELNLEAGARAMEATAHRAALDYLAIAGEALPEGAWETAYALAATIHRKLAEAEYLNGNFDRAGKLFDLAFSRARTDLERAEIECLRITQHTMMTNFVDAIATGCKVLSLLGIDVPLDRLGEAANEGIGRAAMQLHGRDIAALADAPVTTDPRTRLAQRTIAHLTIAAFLANQDLFPVVTALSVNLSLEHGNAPESALTYANFGLIMGAFMGRYREGHEFGKLGLRLCDKLPTAPTATVCLVAGSELMPWVEHVRHTLPVFERGYRAGMESGDILWSGYLLMYRVSHETFSGRSLRAILDALPELFAATVKTKNQGAIIGMLAHQVVLSKLAGVTGNEVVLAGERVDEAAFLRLAEGHKVLMALCFYRILEAQACVILGRPDEALALTRAAEGHLGYIINHVQLAEHRLYQSLAITALYPAADDATRPALRATLDQNRQKLEVWAESCPENFAHKSLLVAAEIARIDGDGAAAIDLYDRAIEAARDSEFIQDQALANELAGRYWLSRSGKSRIAQMYLREARYAYELWGAQRKVAALDAEIPELGSHTRAAETRRGATLNAITSTSRTGSVALDLASVLKASQAISGEISRPDLLRRMLGIVIENAGAQKGVIVLDRDGAWTVEARSSVDAASSVVLPAEPLEESRDVSRAIVNYVIKTAATVVLDDAAREGRFTADPYVVACQPRSILCTPIVHHGKPSGALYLENNLSVGAFTTDRLEVLRVLASQAAISIENANLYGSLEAYNQTLEQKVEERTEVIRRNQKQLVGQEKMAFMGTLSMGIAHEIKNPLNFVNNFAEMSVDSMGELTAIVAASEGRVLDADTAASIREIVHELSTSMEKIRQHGRRADGIVEGMKALAEGQSQEPSATDINGLVERFSNLTQHSRPSKGDAGKVAVRKAYDETLGEATVRPQSLGRALTSVLHNAYEAMEQRRAAQPGYEPALVLQTANLGRTFEIRIRDNGVGIPSKYVKSIFTPFFTTKPVGTGHIGLGLSVASDIVTLEHHGELLVDSREGQYTQITLRLPRDLPAAP